jgi:biopolymer transport protein TolQ
MQKEAAFSIFGLISQADAVVQTVIFILALMSMWCWSIIFEKFYKFYLLKKRSEKFETLFETMILEDIIDDANKNDNHPMAKVFMSAIKEWNINNTDPSISFDKKTSIKERLSTAMQIEANKSIQKLEQGLNFLAIVGSISPFIGLFATVWGIMNSFQGIAVSKNTSLAVVAPGIAEALLATGIGLFAAIPAVFFYNIFTNKINGFMEKIQNFSLQLSNMFSRELDAENKES